MEDVLHLRNEIHRRIVLCVNVCPGNEFCCSDNQLDTMLESMSHASNIFGRCPTCMINLNQHICHMTCSPDQHKFMEVVKTYVNKEGSK